MAILSDDPEVRAVVVAARGTDFSVGMDLVTACDVRLAAADAVFSVRETRMAMVADLGFPPEAAGPLHRHLRFVTGNAGRGSRRRELCPA